MDHGLRGPFPEWARQGPLIQDIVGEGSPFSTKEQSLLGGFQLPSMRESIGPRAKRMAGSPGFAEGHLPVQFVRVAGVLSVSPGQIEGGQEAARR